MNNAESLKSIKNPRFRILCELIVKEMKRLKVPGAAVGIYHNGRESTAGFGVTSVENPLPVTADTLFQTGSISKTFTGTVIMQLAEAGRIDLDSPVKQYIEDLTLQDKDVERRVTVRHLLTHMGGWVGDYFNDFGNGEDALEKMVHEIGKLPQIHPFGKIWSYNNTGFNLASRLLEVVTNKPYEQAMQEMLFDPIGLKMTFFYPSDVLFTHRFAVGHYKENGRVKVSRPWAIGRAGNGVGGVVSTVRDLLQYARFHMGRGKKGMLSRKSLRAMREPQVEAGGRGQMCITWFLRRIGGLSVYSHGGATHGQQANFFFIPEEDFALAILTNSESGGIINDQVHELALQVYFRAQPSLPRPLDLPAAELEPYAGRYGAGIECFDLKVKGKTLVYHDIPQGGFPTPETPPGPALAPMRFQFYEKDKVIGLDEPYKNALGDFIYDEAGRLRYFRVGGRAHPKTG